MTGSGMTGQEMTVSVAGGITGTTMATGNPAPAARSAGCAWGLSRRLAESR